MPVRRIRCHFCSRRVPADSIVCPYCRHNPRGLYLRPSMFIAPVAVVALAALAYAAVNPSVWTRALSLTGAVTPTTTTGPTPRATGTRATALIVTATLRPSFAPTITEVAPPLPSETPNPTPTSSSTPTYTPVRQQVRPTAPPPPTLTPSPTSYPPPILQSPSSGAKLSGRKQAVILAYTSPGSLQPNEWFRVEVIFKDPAANFANWCGWTKDNSIRFPIPYYDDSWPFDRTFRWHVTIARAEAESPSTCQAVYTDLTPPDQEWIFYWY